MSKKIPYVMVSIPPLIFSMAYSYLKYRRKAKKYVGIFRKTLISEGVERKMAKKLASEIKVMEIKEVINLIH